MLKLYAIVDSGNAPNLIEKLKQYNPLYSCLYNYPVQESLLPFAPYLVQLTSEEFKNWLIQLEEPWGIYLVSYVDFNTMRNHLRRQSYVQIPTSRKPVINRYYDPRVIWRFTSVLDDEALHCFLGPIEIIATFYQGYYLQDHFGPRRKGYEKGLKRKTLYLELNEEQLNALDQYYIDDFVQILVEHMKLYLSTSLQAEALQNSHYLQNYRLLHNENDPLSEIDCYQDPNSAILESYFVYDSISKHWFRQQGEQNIPVPTMINQILYDLGQSPIKEQEFHKKSDYRYRDYLEESINNYFSEINKIRSNIKYIIPNAYFRRYHQCWYFIDYDLKAYLIEDDRLEALATFEQDKIMEPQFHQLTGGRYSALMHLPYPTDRTTSDILSHPPLTETELNRQIESLARELIDFCQQREINFQASIKGLGELIMRKNIIYFDAIPTAWLEQLSDLSEDGFYRVELLLRDQLGFIPKSALDY